MENEDSEVTETENDDNKNCTPPSSLSQSSQYGNSSYGADFPDTPETRTHEESSSTQLQYVWGQDHPIPSLDLKHTLYAEQFCL